MGDHKTQTPEWVNLLGKFLMAAAYIAIGIMAKLAIDSRNQKLTRTQIVIKIALSFAMGFCSFMLCEATGKIKWSGVVVPIATMLGETLSIYIFNNINSWLDWASNIFKKKQK